MEHSKALAVNLYMKMMRTRLLEERMVELYQAGKIPGSLHLGIGHEALSVGATACLRQDDYLIFSHRGFGHSIGKDISEKVILAEFMGKAGGCSGGKGGVHLADVEHGSLGISGSQGGNAVIAAGAALGAQYAGTDQVAICFFGEGTANRGPVHEGMNLAAVWDLPVLFICENNFYSFSTPQNKILRIKNVSERAAAYGMPGETIDGTDVFLVYETVKKAADRARQGLGPSLIEGITCRFRGHHERDTQFYRSDEELEGLQTSCPLEKTRLILQDRFGVQGAEIEAMNREAGEIVDAAVRFAEQSPWPAPEKLYTGVYA
jgi:TPP-dependent pyruvate/acetoin dehydrogenase alpha subunit